MASIPTVGGNGVCHRNRRRRHASGDPAATRGRWPDMPHGRDSHALGSTPRRRGAGRCRGTSRLTWVLPALVSIETRHACNVAGDLSSADGAGIRHDTLRSNGRQIRGRRDAGGGAPHGCRASTQVLFWQLGQRALRESREDAPLCVHTRSRSRGVEAPLLRRIQRQLLSSWGHEQPAAGADAVQRVGGELQ
jgi:hypothetical protein